MESATRRTLATALAMLAWISLPVPTEAGFAQGQCDAYTCAPGTSKDCADTSAGACAPVTADLTTCGSSTDVCPPFVASCAAAAPPGCWTAELRPFVPPALGGSALSDTADWYRFVLVHDTYKFVMTQPGGGAFNYRMCVYRPPELGGTVVSEPFTGTATALVWTEDVVVIAQGSYTWLVSVVSGTSCPAVTGSDAAEAAAAGPDAAAPDEGFVGRVSPGSAAALARCYPKCLLGSSYGIGSVRT